MERINIIELMERLQEVGLFWKILQRELQQKFKQKEWNQNSFQQFLKSIVEKSNNVNLGNWFLRIDFTNDEDTQHNIRNISYPIDYLKHLAVKGIEKFEKDKFINIKETLKALKTQNIIAKKNVLNYLKS